MVRAHDWRVASEGSCVRILSGRAAAEFEILFTPFCQCLLEETLKAVGPLYMVSMPGEVKYPSILHRGKCVNCRGPYIRPGQ